MAAIRTDNKIFISPSTIGKRDNVRTKPPLSLDRQRLNNFNPDVRAKAVFSAGRELGLRKKEATLMNYKQALIEAKKTGKIRITEGTKGGRGHSEQVKRYVEITGTGLEVLQKNAQLQGNRNNLIQQGESWKTVNDSLYSNSVRNSFKAAGLKSYHDARAAFACERYLQLTGCDAPAVSGVRLASKKSDKDARLVIARELGHNRIDVCVSYIGSSK